MREICLYVVLAILMVFGAIAIITVTYTLATGGV